LPEEVDHLLAAALRLILKEEMSNVLEQHEPGAGNLPRKTRRVVDREELVLLTPQDQRGHPECREHPLVWLELVGVEGAIELQHAAAAFRGGERLPVLVQRALVERAGGRLEQGGEPLTGDAVHERLALARRSHRPGDLGPLDVRKESRIADHQAAHGIRVVACLAQADQAAGVVDNKHDPVEPDLVAEAFDCCDVALVGPGRIGRRVAVAG
jgi:hypothetical protein